MYFFCVIVSRSSIYKSRARFQIVHPAAGSSWSEFSKRLGSSLLSLSLSLSCLILANWLLSLSGLNDQTSSLSPCSLPKPPRGFASSQRKMEREENIHEEEFTTVLIDRVPSFMLCRRGPGHIELHLSKFIDLRLCPSQQLTVLKRTDTKRMERS